MANKSKKPVVQRVELKHILQPTLGDIPLPPSLDPSCTIVKNFPENTIIYPTEWLGTLNELLGLNEDDLLQYVPSLDKLEEDFADVSKALCLRFPSSMCNQTRFALDENYNFLYDVRESLKVLLTDIETRSKKNAKTVYYIGNIGGGKSYNLAALVAYFRLRLARELVEHAKTKGAVFDQDYFAKLQKVVPVVVYIADLATFFTDPILKLKIVLREAFYFNEAIVREVNDCGTLEELRTIIRRQTFGSILFIMDDWNFVVKNENRACELDGTTHRLFIERAVGDQYNIRAISGVSSEFNDICKPKGNFRVITHPVGLSDSEANCWFSVWDNGTDDKLKGMATDGKADDRHYLKEMTNYIPLVLRDLELHREKDIQQRCRLYMAKHTGMKIHGDLCKFFGPISTPRTDLEKQRCLQIEAANYGFSPPLAYRSEHVDFRYYMEIDSADENSPRIVPINGFVREISIGILHRYLPDTLKSSEMLDKALGVLRELKTSGSLYGCLLELACLIIIQRYPAGIAKSVAPSLCSFESITMISNIHRNLVPSEVGWHLLIPVTRNFRYVDAIILHVADSTSNITAVAALERETGESEEKKPKLTTGCIPIEKRRITVIGVQVTCQGLQQHADSLKFYGADDGFEAFKIPDTCIVDRRFLWVVPLNMPPRIQRTIPNAPKDVTANVVQEIKHFDPQIDWCAHMNRQPLAPKITNLPLI